MSDPILNPPDGNELALLALRPKQAAKALGIGERLLWSMTNNGQIPHVRLGRAIVYPVDELKSWLAEQAKQSKK
jgi:excisionase family DNA binding protein